MRLLVFRLIHVIAAMLFDSSMIPKQHFSSIQVKLLSRNTCANAMRQWMFHFSCVFKTLIRQHACACKQNSNIWMASLYFLSDYDRIWNGLQKGSHKIFLSSIKAVKIPVIFQLSCRSKVAQFVGGFAVWSNLLHDVSGFDVPVNYALFLEVPHARCWGMKLSSWRK